MTRTQISVIGAGITGLWQALTLARAGHKVTLIEASIEPFKDSASILAGAMLAPFCESETAEPIVHELGLAALPIWFKTFPQIVRNGSLVVANARDRSELTRFARLTQGHDQIGADQLAQIEPDLAGRFNAGLFFADEAHMSPRAAMRALLDAVREAGVDVHFGKRWQGEERSENAPAPSPIIVDCRGMAARDELPDLRGVRGERLVIRCKDVTLQRPVRLLHPRHPLYIVPWSDTEMPETERPGSKTPDRKDDRDLGHDGQCYMIGSTLLESEDQSAMTVRSALEMLGMAYALHPAFGEAEILDMAAGVRPAFADNSPKIVVRGSHIHVNGMYRHGFLVAPMMAMLVADYIAAGQTREDVFVIE